jgi:hypothetical protein
MTLMGAKRVIHGVSLENLEERRRTKSEYNIKLHRQEVMWRAWTAFIWLRIATSGRLL